MSVIHLAVAGTFAAGIWQSLNLLVADDTDAILWQSGANVSDLSFVASDKRFHILHMQIRNFIYPGPSTPNRAFSKPAAPSDRQPWEQILYAAKLTVGFRILPGTW